MYASLNEEFHQAIFAAAHNETLAEVAKNLRQRLAPFRGRLFFVSRNRMARSHDEHDALVAAIVAQDADAAAHAMREHGAHSAMNALERMRGEAPAMAPL